MEYKNAKKCGGDIKISASQTVFHRIMFLEILLDTLHPLFHLSPAISPLPRWKSILINNFGKHNIVYFLLIE